MDDKENPDRDNAGDGEQEDAGGEEWPYPELECGAC
jgi:hypothetical protein